jgi:hypothetical protein
MTFLKITSLASVALILFSCNKGPTDNSRVQADSTLLTTVFELDPFATATAYDTFARTLYYFDDNKRVKKTRHYLYLSNFGDAYYFYSGNEQKPFMVTRYGVDVTFNDTTSIDTSFYYYQADKLIRDSTINYYPNLGFPNRRFDAHSYTYSGTTITANFHYYHDTYIGEARSTESVTVTPGGTNTVILEKKRYLNNVPGVISTTRYRIVYDDKPNPRSKPNAPEVAYGLFEGLNLWGFPNNVTDCEKTFDDSSNATPWHHKFVYTYRSDGYPLACVDYDLINNYPPYFEKILFTYQ